MLRALCLLGTGAAGIAVGSSCADDAFLCDNTQDCSGVDGGVCEPVGYCSRPSTRCPSGREFAPHSGGLTGQCVEPTAGDGSSDGGGGSGSSGAVDDGGVADDGGSAEGTAGADGVDTSSATTGPDPDDGGSSSSGGASLEPCYGGEVLLSEDFEGTGLSALDWVLDSDGTAEASVADGALTLSAQAWSEGPDLWAAAVGRDLPIRGSMMMEVVSPPSTADALVWLEMWGGGEELYLEVYDDTLASAYWDGMGFPWNTATPFDPEQHRWLRISWDYEGGWLDLDVSADGQTWSSFDTFEIGYELQGVSFGGGVVEDYEYEGDFASVDNVIVCSFP